jgi:FAD dependent oxidoreductase TIGR03364
VIAERCELAVVGAGIVGLACALEAAERGLDVVVLERDEHAVGASVRNFGHGFVTGQDGEAFAAALVARRRWLELAPRAGFAARAAGTVLVARHADELAVCEELAADPTRGATVLSAAQVRERVPVAGDGVVGGLFCGLDVLVDQRAAPAALAAHLAAEHGVRVRFATAVHAVEGTTLHTAAGTLEAERVVVCPGPDLDTLFSDVLAQAGVSRVALQMLTVDAPAGLRLEPALVTGLSLLRYAAFAGCPSVGAVRARLEAQRPELLEAGIHLIVTQRPDGALTLGDTHRYARTPSPFSDERLDELVLAEAAGVLGVERLAVRERWQGVYPHAPGRDFLIAAPHPAVRVVAITSGIGMTTAFGLAPRVLADLLPDPDQQPEEASA